MKLVVSWVSARAGRTGSAPAGLLTDSYILRACRLNPTEAAVFSSEAALLAAVERDATRRPGRAAALLILFDSRGETLTSEQFAELLGRSRDAGAQRMLLAIGPADGWSKAALARATRIISFGRMTLPHELARAVLAEQVYRALTLLAGHPYHSGHQTRL